MMNARVKKLQSLANRIARKYREDGYFRFDEQTHLRGLTQMILAHRNGNMISIFTDLERSQVRVWFNSELKHTYNERGYEMRES